MFGLVPNELIPCCSALIQTHALKSFSSAPLSLTSLICFMGTLQAIAVTLVMERKPSVWKIGFDMNLLAAAYAVRNASSCSAHKLSLFNFSSPLTSFPMFCQCTGHRDIEYRLLCPRTGDTTKGSCLCLCFQPSNDDHSGHHGILYPC